MAVVLERERGLHLMIHCYGDSWTYGSDLKDGEIPYPNHLGTRCHETFINRGKPGNSNLRIYHDFMEDLTHGKIKEKDKIVFCFTEITRFTAWDQYESDSTYCKYIPVFPYGQDRHRELFKWTFDEDQGLYDLWTTMIVLHNICKQNKFNYVFGFAFGEDHLIKTSFRPDVQKLVNYINELKMNRADRRFKSFSKNLKEGEHSDHEGHIKYAEYLWSYLK